MQTQARAEAAGRYTSLKAVHDATAVVKEQCTHEQPYGNNV